MEKPPKKVYATGTQERLFQGMQACLNEIFESDTRIKEILVYGSCAKKEFGIYKTTYKLGTPVARDKTDIDTIFLVTGLQGKEITLTSGYTLQDCRFVTDAQGQTVTVEGHPVMCANLTTPEQYYANIDKPWPEGYDYTKNSILLYKRA